MRNFSAYNGNKPYIFVSYSHKDTDYVMQIVNQMIGDGYRVWYDEGIKPGSEWDEFIANKISNSGLFLAFISPNYLESSNCKDELNYARDHIDNILLVYLTDVRLPSGMELRFGRTQAIPAYNYSSRDDFFKKLYSTHKIDDYREYGVPGGFSTPVIATTSPNRPSVKSPVKAPVRVDRKPQNNNKKIFIIAAICLAILVIIIVVAVVANSDKSEAKYATYDGNAEQTESVKAGDETSEAVATAPSDTTPTNETTSIDTETTTTPSTEATDDLGGGYEYESLFTQYHLMDGESYYNSVVNDNFFNNTGAVYVGYLEGDRYQNGTFHATNTMSVRVPALDGYSEEVSVNWYYMDSNNEACFIYGDYHVVPSMVDGETSYVSIINGTVFDDGRLKAGTYYVTFTDTYNGLDMSVTRIFYSQD